MGTYGLFGDKRDIGPLFHLEAVPSLNKARRLKPRDEIPGMGHFSDLRQLEMFAHGEVFR
jgi:hypothetical protein